MTSKYLYLIIDLLILAVPLAASFYQKFTFYNHWKNAGIGLAITTVFFLLWDVLFIQLGIRNVNEQYITGVYLGPIPIEEVLFLIGIPFAGQVAYFVLNKLFEKDRLFPHQEIISSLLIVVLLIGGLYHKDRIYTAAAFLILAIFLAFQMLKLRPRYMGRFYFTFAFLLIPLLLVSSILTGAFIGDGVVHYNDTQNLGIRLGTIPLEDLVGAMLLLVMPITVWEWLEDYAYYKRR